MNAPQSVRNARAKLIQRFHDVRESRFFHDRLFVGLIVAALGFNLLALLMLVAKVRPTDVPVPTHYSTLGSFDQLGPWYFPFEVVAFALGVSVVNAGFAYSSYLRSRLASFFLLSGAVVVAVFSLIIAGAFGAVAPQ